MDAPPPAQPDAAAPPPSTAASAPPSLPPPNPAPSVSTAAPPTSDSTPAPAPAPAPTPVPAQTLEPPATVPASARPPPPRMRPPYTHLASPITMSSSSSAAAAAASSSAMPRGGVAIGLPAHPRGAQTPMGYTGFVPPPPLAHQFSPMHRGPDQPPPPAPQIDPSERLDPEVEDVLIDIAEDFIESVGTFACSLAKHRKSSTLEAKDVLLHAERSWNITLPGFTGDEIKLYKKPHVNDIHRERLTLIKKSMASEGNTKSSAAQAAANQKNQAPKPPATGSP